MTVEKYFCPGFNLQIPGHGRTLVLKSDLHLQSGEVCALFGPSDPLVQDFLYLVAGLHRFRGLTSPGAGGYGREAHEAAVPPIALSGIEIYSLTKQQRAAQIAFIYENPEVAIIGRTVIDEFQYSFAACDRPRSMGGAMALEPYGLQYKLDRDTDTLSGGEKHRLNCACALEVRPKMVVADFTASNLDSDFLEAFLRHLGKFAKDGGMVVVAGVRNSQLHLLSSAPQCLVFEQGSISPINSAPAAPDESQQIKSALGARTAGPDVVMAASEISVAGRTRAPFSATLRTGEIAVCRAVNGFGKTTVAQVLAKRIKKHGGSVDRRVQRPTLAIQHPERSLLQSTVQSALANDSTIGALCGLSAPELAGHPLELTRAKQKLLSIAVALAASDGVAILDEPTCGMDAQTKELLGKLIAHYGQLAIMIFTHDPALFDLGTNIQWQ